MKPEHWKTLELFLNCLVYLTTALVVVWLGYVCYLSDIGAL
jgi:hypothetical protein